MPIKIFGYKYKLVYIKDNESDDMGVLHNCKLIIEIAPGIEDAQKVSTVLHEIIEGINKHLDLRLAHQKIDSLEAGLYQVMVDNGVDLSPLIKDLIKKKK